MDTNKALADMKPDQLMAAMQLLAQHNPQYVAALQAAQAAAAAAAQAKSSSSAATQSTNANTTTSSNPPAATSSAVAAPTTAAIPAAVLPQYSVPAPAHGGSKYNHLLMIIEEINKDIRPTYSGNRNCADRLKRGITQARVLVRETLIELDKQSRANAASGSSST